MKKKIVEIPKKIFCEGIKCEYVEVWDEEDETWVTCTAKKCPYSKSFIKGWYKGQDDTLKRISEKQEKSLLTDEEIKEVEEKWIAGALPEQMISLGRGHYEDITPIIAQAQLQKILDLLK